MTAAGRSKWLDWKPEKNIFPGPTTVKTDKTQPEAKLNATVPAAGGAADQSDRDQNISLFPETELTKLTKLGSVGFVSPNLGETQIISAPEQDPAVENYDPLDAPRQPFIAWFDAKIQLDVQAIALQNPNPRWCAGVAALHADFCRWMFEHDQVPPTRGEFRHLLQELCFEIRGCGHDEYVANISLRVDVLVQERFQLEPMADSPMPGMPTAAGIMPAAQGIQLPLGVKLDQPTPQPAQ